MESTNTSTKRATRMPSFAKKSNEHQPPKIKKLTHEELTKLVSNTINKVTNLSVTSVLGLTSQYPYSDADNMDFYKPGRWDTSINLVFMDVIVDGQLPGEWDGTAGYVRFTAPANATYVVFAYFTGYEINMRLHGPWGTVESYTATTSDTGLVLTTWSGTAGDSLYFTIDCVGPIIGYLESILVYEVIF